MRHNWCCASFIKPGLTSDVGAQAPTFHMSMVREDTANCYTPPECTPSQPTRIQRCLKLLKGRPSFRILQVIINIDKVRVFMHTYS